MTQCRQPGLVSDRRVLTEAQRQGRACIYCPVTFGTLDPVPAPAGADGVMFLAAHRACLEASKLHRAHRAHR